MSLSFCVTLGKQGHGDMYRGKGSAWVSLGTAIRSEEENSYGVAVFTGTRFPSVAPHKEGSLQSLLEGPLSPREWQEVRDAGVQLRRSKTMPHTVALLYAVLSVT